MPNVLMRASNLQKIYSDAGTNTSILNGVDLELYEGETLAIVGASGSGKSTLLHLLSTLDKPTNGRILFESNDLLTLSEKQLAKFRNENLGFVYQFHHLLPEFSALENVAMPKLIKGESKSNALKAAQALIERVDLQERANHTPEQLSGGERQRVAIARALVNQPKVIMADEPTGNLDASTSESIFKLIDDINQTSQTSFVIVTHDNSLAQKLDRTLTLVNGAFV